MDSAEREYAKHAIRELSIFSDCDEEAIEAIVHVATLTHYRPGESVFREGEPVVGMYVVKSGWLRSYKISQSGREIVVRFAGPGKSLNEMAVFSRGDNTASSDALEDSSVWVLRRNAVLALLDKHPAVAKMLMGQMASRIEHLMQLVADLSLRSVTQRLIQMLLDHSTTDTITRPTWSTQNEMAARLGTVPDVVSRVLRGLVEEGLIEIDRRTLKILDRDRLASQLDDV